ncbi:uncharacterized protein LOC124418962 [Lucilia cuprina]|uniref:uncharacterized protein LOC124418962 n=1 Tax=Lucilia cuprina TaxID=7375 RepID=UPI001F059286|nr:uncharacterized protein LOC124418962 [Lucilia cuprina]
MEPTQRLDLCRICFQKHHLRNCKLFNGFSVRQRIYTVRAHRYCLNCLSRSHLVRECTTTSSCRRCGEMHHTLLHTGHTDSEAVVPPQRRSVQDRLQIPSRDRRIPNRVTPPQQPRRLQHSARPVSGDRNHHQHSPSEESGSLQVVSSRRMSFRRPVN